MADAAPAATASRGGRKRGTTSALSQTCRVCGRGLTTGAERKLRRHADCEATYDEATWEALRAWRKAEADAASMPAFVVFTDATLMAIAEQMPEDLAALATISGVGRTKLERYGEGVLGVLAGHR